MDKDKTRPAPLETEPGDQKDDNIDDLGRRPDGTRQFEFSEVWHDGTVLRSIVESETKRMEYYGWMQHGSIWWQSHFDAETTFHQLHIEQLRPTHHGFQLSLHGYRWTAFSNQPGFLRIHGELHRIQPEEVFEFLQMMPE